MKMGWSSPSSNKTDFVQEDQLCDGPDTRHRRQGSHVRELQADHRYPSVFGSDPGSVPDLDP